MYLTAKPVYVRMLDKNLEVSSMSLKESATTEFKSTVIDDIKKSVIAFANSGGGTLINVQSGTERPYYLVGKGIRPEGVYIC